MLKKENVNRKQLDTSHTCLSPTSMIDAHSVLENSQE